MESKVAQLPLSDKAWAWFETNKKAVVWGGAVAAVVGLIVWFVLWQQGERDMAASNALSEVVAGAGGDPARADSPGAYLTIAEKYAGSRAGSRALLMAGGLYFSEGKYAEAQKQFERFSREYRQSPLLGEALLGTAASQDALGNKTQAMESYQNLIERHPSDAVVPQAKFALAGLQEAQNKPEAARDLYEQVEKADPYGSLGDEARMRLEDLKAKNPSLATPAPAKAPTTPALAPAKAPTGLAPAPAKAPAVPQKK